VLGHAVLRPRSTRSRFSSFGASASLEVCGGVGSGAGSGASASFAGVSRGLFAPSGPAAPPQPELPDTDSFSLEYVEEMRKQEYELRRARSSDYTRRRSQVLDRRAPAPAPLEALVPPPPPPPQQQVPLPLQQVPQQQQAQPHSSPACDSDEDQQERKAADEAPIPVKVRLHVPVRVVTLASKKID
jgi:hypothetical protein